VLIYRNADGVHGQRKFDNTCPKAKRSPVAKGNFGGISPQTKLQAPPNWSMKHHKSVEICHF